MEIKRVIAGGLATIAAGATLALGAGAVTLGDFVTVSGNSMTSPYLVIGGNAAAEDTLAAADIGVALAGQATQTVSVAGAMAEMSVSNGALVKTKSDYLFLDEAFSNTRSKFTYQELAALLASGTVELSGSETTDYTQRLYTKAQTATFNTNSEEDEWTIPKLHVELTKNANLYTYEIRFSPAMDVEEIDDDSEIEMLGTKYVFSETDADNECSGTGCMVTLYASSQTETLIPGDVVTVTAGGTDYTVEVVAIDSDDDEAVIKINGDANTYAAGDDIEEGDFEAHVKEVFGSTDYSYVSLFIGSQSMVLEHGEEVTVGGDGIDGTTIAITNSTDSVSKIEITYAMDDDVVLEADESFTDPVFGGFKVVFGGIFPALEDASKDHVRFEPSSDEVEVTFTNLDGSEYGDVLFSLSGTTFSLNDGSNAIHWHNNATVDEDEYVVVTDNDEYSYVLQFTDVNSDDEAILEDIATGTEYTITTSDIGTDIAIGSLDIPVLYYDGSGTLSLNNTGAALNSAAWLITKNGAAFSPYANFSADTGSVEATVEFYTPAAGEAHLNFTEDISGAFDETEVSVNTFAIVLTDPGSTDEIDVDTSNSEIAGDTDEDMSFYLTNAGTYIEIDTSDQKITNMWIPDEPTPVYVAFGSDPAFSAGEGAAGGTVEQAVQIQNSISKMESEVSTSSLSRDLVLLGGPCANGLVATLLEMSASKPDCVSDFTALYPTEGVITVVEDAFDSGHKALVVAGVDRTKTRDLAVKVMQGTLEYSA